MSDDEIAMNNAALDSVLYNAFERAFEELPDGYELNVHCIKGSGVVYLTDKHNKEFVVEGDGWLAEDIHAAVDKALELEFDK